MAHLCVARQEDLESVDVRKLVLIHQSLRLRAGARSEVCGVRCAVCGVRCAV